MYLSSAPLGPEIQGFDLQSNFERLPVIQNPLPGQKRPQSEEISRNLTEKSGFRMCVRFCVGSISSGLLVTLRPGPIADESQ